MDFGVAKPVMKGEHVYERVGSVSAHRGIAATRARTRRRGAAAPWWSLASRDHDAVRWRVDTCPCGAQVYYMAPEMVARDATDKSDVRQAKHHTL